MVLMLPGQGAQHPGMATELYGLDDVFTAILDQFFAQLDDNGDQLDGDAEKCADNQLDNQLDGPGTRLRREWLSAGPADALDDASRAQPLLFAIDYAVARSLCARGVRPAVLLGHSVGELAAAALAGVFDFADGVRLLSARTAATADAPAGGMLAVGADAVALQPFVDDDDDPAGVVVGARNAPRQTVLAGPRPRLGEVAGRLTEAGLPNRPVRAAQPFHSPALRPATERFASAFGRITLRAPSIPIRSTRTAELVRPEQAVDPWFWAGQVAAPVLFWPALDALLGGGDHTLVETGPGQGLTAIAHQHRAVRRGTSVVVPTLARTARGSARVWQAALRTLTE
jgi:[acyl-carrier-protein] S-malonyltransferase